MAETRSTFLKRVVSALLATVVILGVVFYGDPKGLFLAITVVVVLGIREFARMAFTHWNLPNTVSVAYWLISLSCYTIMYLDFDQAILWFALASSAFLVSAMWLSRGKVSNENLLAALALGIFGLCYCVLFPVHATQLVALDDGAQWFLFLLLVVFFGDIFAYFSGRWFGRHKFMPMISPNKTWEGALGGMLGSALAGSVHVLATFPSVPLWKTVVFCLVCAIFAQSGDLLMSLVKRVAQVKDTGTIMPGHGGVLDRLDGIFIACPLVYAFALYVSPGQIL